MNEERLKSVVIVGMAGFMAFMGYMVQLTVRVQGATEPVIEAFYAKYNAGEFRSIKDTLLAAPAEAGAVPEQLRALFEASGKCPDKVRRSFKLKDLQGKRIYYRYDASCEKGGRTDVFVLRDAGGLRFALESFPGSEAACPGTR